ncbi:MAG: peptidylprolyl isomerase [Candidatus Cloacimonetes bacterium]|nr:peptidylprolyl isomerase [Candidatus Cloacimonadota bacterium]
MKKCIMLSLMLLVLVVMQAELVDKIVAQVGTDIILLSDLQKQLAQMQSSGTMKEDTDPQQVLSSMIVQKLMIQKAKELNIKVDETKIKSMATRYLKQVKSQYPSDAEFTKDLRDSKLTEADLLKYYEDMFTESSLTEQMVTQQISSKINISDEEMEDFYAATKDTLAVKPTTWKVGMIIREIKSSEASRKAKLAEMEKIQERLKKGEDFANLAAAESDCPSKEVGGDLGFFTAGMMVKPFEDAAFKLNIGEVSEIVETQFGYHIIKVEEKRGTEVRARHILKMLSASAADTLAERELMETIRQRFIAGESFATLAGEYSTDEESKADGGSIGEFSQKDFPELFAVQVMQAPVGGITPVLENEGMLYLFSRLEELPPRIFSYEEVKEQVQQFLFRQKQMETYDQWVDKLMKESYVQITL